MLLYRLQNGIQELSSWLNITQAFVSQDLLFLLFFCSYLLQPSKGNLNVLISFQDQMRKSSWENHLTVRLSWLWLTASFTAGLILRRYFAQPQNGASGVIHSYEFVIKMFGVILQGHAQLSWFRAQKSQLDTWSLQLYRRKYSRSFRKEIGATIASCEVLPLMQTSRLFIQTHAMTHAFRHVHTRREVV